MAALGLIDRYARSLIQKAASKGYDNATISRELDIDPDSLLNPGTRFGPEALMRISRNVKLMMADEFCGFTRTPCRIGAFAMMCEIAALSGTLGDALRRSFQFYALMSDEISFELHVDGDVATLAMSVAHPEFDEYNFLYEWWFIVWTHFASWLIGEELSLLSVEFPHPPGGTLEEYAEVLSPACRFSQAQARVVFPASYLARRLVRSVDDLGAFMSPKSLDLVNVGGVHKSFKALLMAKLRDHLHKTQELLSIEDAATEYGISSQTLRRRLEREGTSYRVLKDEVRREAVMKWLSDADIPIGEISIKAGFAESNALSRALKSWVGVSPSEYRHSVSAGMATPQPEVPTTSRPPG
jgi:AraC-like DNA-binding protein